MYGWFWRKVFEKERFYDERSVAPIDVPFLSQLKGKQNKLSVNDYKCFEMFHHHLLALVSSLFGLLGRVDHQTKLLEVKPGGWEGRFIRIYHRPKLLEVSPLTRHIFISSYQWSLANSKIKIHKFRLLPPAFFSPPFVSYMLNLCTIETFTFYFFILFTFQLYMCLLVVSTCVVLVWYAYNWDFNFDFLLFFIIFTFQLSIDVLTCCPHLCRTC